MQDWEKFKFQEILSSLMKIVTRRKDVLLAVWDNKWGEFSQIKMKIFRQFELFPGIDYDLNLY